MNLAELYRRTKRMDDAVKEYERLLGIPPSADSAHMILAMIAEQRNGIPKAQTPYRSTLEIELKFSPATKNLSWLMAQHGGKIDEALPFSQSARAQQANNLHIANAFGWIYYKKSAYLKAVSLLPEAAGKLSENLVVHYHLGMAHLKNGDRLKGKKMLEAVFQFSPNFSD